MSTMSKGISYEIGTFQDSSLNYVFEGSDNTFDIKRMVIIRTEYLLQLEINNFDHSNSK